jgi:hypothetical protein
VAKYPATVVLWLVLVYTLPAEPTRKRAFVWRELKKLGAVYLRDGVCLVPDQHATRQAMHAIVERVRAYEGQATLIEAATLDDLTVTEATLQVRAARAAEYDEVVGSGRELLAHVEREARHRDLPQLELEMLQRDVAKLRRWYEQIRTRDYFLSDAAGGAETALVECEAALRRTSVQPTPV